MRSSWIWPLIACAAAAFAEAILSGSGVKAWFRELRLPAGTPPIWVWALIAMYYYVLFFLILKSLLTVPTLSYWPRIAVVLAAALLSANASWNWIFFRKRDCWLSFLFFVPYLLLAFMLAAVLYRIQNPMFGWYALYLAYLMYAAWWGYRVWLLNRQST